MKIEEECTPEAEEKPKKEKSFCLSKERKGREKRKKQKNKKKKKKKKKTKYGEKLEKNTDCTS